MSAQNQGARATRRSWHIIVEGHQYGPYTFAELADFVRRGHVQRRDLVWSASHDTWVAAGTIAGLFAQRAHDQGETAAAKAPPPDAANSNIKEAPSAGHEPRAREARRSNYLLRHWRGELSLPVSYWVNGFLGNILIVALSTAIWSNTNFKDDFQPGVALASVGAIWVLGLLVACWQVVGGWRSATRHKRLHPGNHWGVVAKVMLAIAATRCVFEFLAFGVPQIGEYYRIFAGEEHIPKFAFRVLRDGQELEFSGGIRFGAAKEFQRFLDAMGALKVVHLHSEGGRIAEAERMGQLIKQRKLDTYVSAECLSACTVVFLSGRERYISPDGRLGFHQPDFPGMTEQERRSVIVAEERRLVKLGVSAGFARKANAAAPSDMWFPTTAELLSERVATRVADASQFALSGIDPNEITSELVHQLLAGDEIYVAIRRIDAGAYARIAGQVEKGLRRGASTAELRAEVAPIANAVYYDILPHTAPELLADAARLIIRFARTARRENPVTCYRFFNPRSGAAASGDVMKNHRELSDADDALMRRVFTSFSGRVYTPEASELIDPFQKIEATLLQRFGADFEIIWLDAVQPQKYATYCDVWTTLYEEILKLPSAEAAAFLRYELSRRYLPEKSDPAQRPNSSMTRPRP